MTIQFLKKHNFEVEETYILLVIDNRKVDAELFASYADFTVCDKFLYFFEIEIASTKNQYIVTLKRFDLEKRQTETQKQEKIDLDMPLLAVKFFKCQIKI